MPLVWTATRSTILRYSTVLLRVVFGRTLYFFLGGQALQTRNINQFIDLGIFWNILDYFWNILRYTHLQAHDIAHKVTFSFALQSRRFGRQTGASHNAGATLMSVCRSSGLAPKKGTPFWWLQKPVRHPARRSILMYMTYRYAW